MPDAGVINTCRVTWPLMSRPRMLPAWVRTSSVLAANFTPPALPRPPIFTWDLTITGRPSRSAAATASSTVVTTVPSGAGTPWARNSSLAWYSYRSTWSPDASRGFAERSEHGSQEAPGARGPTTRPYRDRRSDGQSGWYEARHPAGSERGLSPADSAHPRPMGATREAISAGLQGPADLTAHVLHRRRRGPQRLPHRRQNLLHRRRRRIPLRLNTRIRIHLIAIPRRLHTRHEPTQIRQRRLHPRNHRTQITMRRIRRRLVEREHTTHDQQPLSHHQKKKPGPHHSRPELRPIPIRRPQRRGQLLRLLLVIRVIQPTRITHPTPDIAQRLVQIRHRRIPRRRQLLPRPERRPLPLTLQRLNRRRERRSLRIQPRHRRLQIRRMLVHRILTHRELRTHRNHPFDFVPMTRREIYP